MCHDARDDFRGQVLRNTRWCCHCANIVKCINLGSPVSSIARPLSPAFCSQVQSLHTQRCAKYCEQWQHSSVRVDACQHGKKTTIKIPKRFTLVMHLCRALTMNEASRTGSALHESVTESLGRDCEDLELYCVA